MTTGGTIEKTYDETDGSLQNRGTFIKSLINAKLRLPATLLEVKPLMSKDSLYMTEQDRESIALAIEDLAKNQNPIIVLHGTDTMDKSARYCQAKLPNINIPVIFTGAMRPVGFDNSDAIQNITEALAFAKVIPSGFYISFHNQIFPADKAKKNRTQLTFEAIE